MEMEVPEEFNDHCGLIVRGKRTKRLRPSSPSDVVLSSSSSGGGCGKGDGHNDLYFSVLSPAMSSEISTGAITSEEDEDMANCLILLAKGEHVEAEVGSETKKAPKRRRLTEMAVKVTSKAGFYVYECKTCNRTFPSFQALGGHRASHKKPKTAPEEKKSAPPLPQQIKKEERAEEEQAESNNKIVTPPLPLPLPLPLPQPLPPPHIANNKGIQGANNNSKPKVHECSICGSEFSSGQALGGHMRRHRIAPPPPSTRIIPPSTIESKSKTRPRNFLALDLNLPAPEEESSKFQFTTNSHHQHLVFSTTALVDCHY